MGYWGRSTLQKPRPMSLSAWFRRPAPRTRDGAAVEEPSVFGFTSESTEAGRMIELDFNTILFDLAAERTRADGRDSVTADDVEASVPEAARRLAAEYADAVVPEVDVRREETAAAA